jgi:cytochrome-b5 reductase
MSPLKLYQHTTPQNRPYTPIFQGTTKGEFTVLMKLYDPPGKMSGWMDQQSIGAQIEFKHVEKDIKIQYPFFGSSGATGMLVKDSITMIAGGSGITPMFQALESIMNHPGDETQVVLLYGNRTPTDILLKDELAKM